MEDQVEVQMVDLCATFGITLAERRRKTVTLRMGDKSLVVAFRTPRNSTAADVLAHCLSGQAMLDDEHCAASLTPEDCALVRGEIERARAFLGEHFDLFCDAQH